MPERTVKLGSMFYIDDDGRGRRADCGTKIQVHPDFVKKFDDLNHLFEETEVEFVPPIAPEAVEAEQREVPKPGRPRKGAE